MLDLQLLVSLQNFLLDPLGELTAKHCVYHICQPLPGQLRNLLPVGQIGHELRASDRVLHHGLDGYPFVLGAVDILEVIALEC